MRIGQIDDFAARYTAAWCSRDPASVAAFFSPAASLTINGGPPAGGRSAIADVARSFMADFPDLHIAMEKLVPRGDGFEYHWTLTGSNTGPGGSGNRVKISGFEYWRIGADGLIASSEGHFDAADYRRQLNARPPAP